MKENVRAVNLAKKFGEFTAVDSVSFSVKKGEIYGFLGANGAGKTTTIRMLCGLLSPDKGRAVVSGYDTAKQPDEVKKRIGYMSQKFSLYPDLTTRENIQFYAGIYNMEKKEINKKIPAITEKTMLGKEIHTLIREMPPGVRQRVALACALIHEPGIVFLDEPTAGVDPVLRRTFWEIINSLSGAGVTVFVTTHYMDEVEHCNRVALMNEGRIIKEGGTRQLKKEVFGRGVYETRPDDVVKAYNKAAKLRENIGDISMHGAGLHIIPLPGIAAPKRRIESQFRSAGIKHGVLHRVEPTMEDVFVSLIRRER